MKAYRIDNRDFNEGDPITPQNSYQDKLDDTRKKVEEILEKHRPTDKPPRRSILMLFQEFKNANHHWTIQRNSKFYRTDISENDILHIGDYNKVEELYRFLCDSDKAERIAKEYWSGEMTDNPKKEIYVNTASVSKVLSKSEEERKNAYAIRGGLGRPGIRIITDN
jgi:hypothetical protein